tara:strand:+ start:162 stop:470 length:309 start_codon:yes stop_codon:yes gene_type:complete
MEFQVARAEESLRAAGALDVTTANLLRYSGWHLMGTAKMGDNPETSVVNRFQQAHDIENLYIVDGSVFVTSSGVNPTATITALALRTADNIVKSRSQQAVPT